MDVVLGGGGARVVVDVFLGGGGARVVVDVFLGGGAALREGTGAGLFLEGASRRFFVVLPPFFFFIFSLIIIISSIGFRGFPPLALFAPFLPVFTTVLTFFSFLPF